MDNVTRLLMQGAAGAAGSLPYVDDVFSTYVYRGDGATRSINNGVDNTKGGMVWIKDRTNAYNNVIQDTVRGAGATTKLASNDNWAEGASDNGLQWSGYINSFNNNGFSLDKTGSGSIDWANVNKNADDYTSWNFRKQEGFFDIVSYTGNGSNRNISHNLGCKPGMIIIKDLDDTDNWEVYHKSLPEYNGSDNYYLILNTSTTQQYGASRWNNTAPTASSFRLGQSTSINQNGSRYVAYLFAGGQSDATGARCVNFQSSNEKLEVPSSTDFNFGSGAFTIECWVKFDGNSANQVFVNRSYWGASGNSSWLLFGNANGNVDFYGTTNSSSWNLCQISAPARVNDDQWHHVAVVRDNVGGGQIRIYVDGTLSKTQTINTSTAFDDCTRIVEIGSQWNSAWLNGRISNVRIVKGTAVYTTSFKPSTVPLTNISGTVLLCCNNASVTGATVTPGTITAVNTPDAQIYNPFDDPAGFIFGENEDQNIIKCGSFLGTGSDQKINLGFEPQWFLWKQISGGGSSWVIFDSMRGMVTTGNDKWLYPSSSGGEVDADALSLDPDGVTILGSSGLSMNNQSFVYMAIRRPDGLVGKPAEAGTDVFNMVRGNSSTTVPAFVSGFPVDFRMAKTFSSAANWYQTSRLTDNNEVTTNLTFPASTGGWTKYDSNTGEGINWDSTYQGWMWKRGQGMDFVAYKGNGTAGSQIKHNLSKTPEMIWIKDRTNNENWFAWHSGFNSGTTPEQWSAELNNSAAQAQITYMNNVAPTSICFTVGSHGMVNGNNNNYSAWLFASVEGISKCGYYTGTGASGNSITLGFQPRFLFLKNMSNSSTNWLIYDTLRGWTGTNDQFISLNQNFGQGTTTIGPPTSTGFTVNATNTSLNSSGDNFIYYAHA